MYELFLNKRKIGATILSGIVVSINEMPDGCAETDMDREFKMQPIS